MEGALKWARFRKHWHMHTTIERLPAEVAKVRKARKTIPPSWVYHFCPACWPKVARVVVRRRRQRAKVAFGGTTTKLVSKR